MYKRTQEAFRQGISLNSYKNKIQIKDCPRVTIRPYFKNQRVLSPKRWRMRWSFRNRTDPSLISMMTQWKNTKNLNPVMKETNLFPRTMGSQNKIIKNRLLKIKIHSWTTSQNRYIKKTSSSLRNPPLRWRVILSIKRNL